MILRNTNGSSFIILSIFAYMKENLIFRLWSSGQKSTEVQNRAIIDPIKILMFSKKKYEKSSPCLDFIFFQCFSPQSKHLSFPKVFVELPSYFYAALIFLVSPDYTCCFFSRVLYLVSTATQIFPSIVT